MPKFITMKHKMSFKFLIFKWLYLNTLYDEKSNLKEKTGQETHSSI